MQIALIGYEANVKNRVGSNQYAFELIKALYKQDRQNQYSVYLPTPPLSDLPQPREKWEYRVVGPTRFWNALALPWALYRQQPRPELVFSPGHYAPLFCPAPLVVSIMDLGFLRFPQQFTRQTLAKLKFWTQFSVKRAAHVLAISEFTRSDIMRSYQIEPERVTATPLGYDSKFKIKDLELKIKQVKEKYRLSGDYLLSLGTLKPSKNIEGLLEALLKLKTQNLKLVIAGKKGWLFKTIFGKVKTLGLEKEVVFTGFVEEADVPGLIAGAKVFVMPSFWEGFGIPALEAMALGIPVVVANVASLPEIVGKAGILVDPYQPENIAWGIREALERRKELSAKGIARARRFSWEKCAQKTLEVFRKIKPSELGNPNSIPYRKRRE